MKKLVLAAAAIATVMGSAASAAHVTIKNHTQAHIHYSATENATDDNGFGSQINGTLSGSTTAIMLNGRKDIASVKHGVIYAGHGDNVYNNLNVLATELFDVTLDQAKRGAVHFHFNYWQQAPGYFVLSVDAYDKLNNKHVKLQ